MSFFCAKYMKTAFHLERGYENDLICSLLLGSPSVLGRLPESLNKTFGLSPPPTPTLGCRPTTHQPSFVVPSHSLLPSFQFNTNNTQQYSRAITRDIHCQQLPFRASLVVGVGHIGQGIWNHTVLDEQRQFCLQLLPRRTHCVKQNGHSQLQLSKWSANSMHGPPHPWCGFPLAKHAHFSAPLSCRWDQVLNNSRVQ